MKLIEYNKITLISGQEEKYRNMSGINDKKIMAHLVDKEIHEVHNGTISVRPLKIVFFFNRELKSEGLRKIIQFNSSIWSGIYNLIIPSDGSQIANYSLSSLLQFEPDILIFAGNFDADYMDLWTEKTQPFKRLTWSDELLQPEHWTTLSPGALHIYLYYNYLFKGNRPSSQSESNIRLPSYGLNDVNGLLIDVQFGCLPDRLHEFLEKYMYSSQVNFREGDFADYLNGMTELNRRVYPLYLTSYGVNHRVYWGETGYMFVIARANSVDDVCLYWNLRSGPGMFVKRVYIIPYEPLSDDTGIKYFADWCNQNITGTNTISLCSIGVDKEGLLSLKARIKPLIGNKLNRIDIYYAGFCLEAYRIYAADRYEEVAIDNGIASFTPPRIPWLDDPKRMEFAVDLSFEKTNDKSKRFWPPSYPGLNKALIDNPRYKFFIASNGYPFRISDGRLSYISNDYADVKQIALPDNEEIFQKLLKHYKFDSNVSEKCRYIQRIVDLFGGLDKSSPLKIEKWRDVFEKMCKDSKDIVEMQQIYKPGNDRSAFYEKTREFSLNNIFLRGFKIRCPSCGYSHWYVAEEIREIIKCVGCRASMQPPLECPFSYKLNDLVARGVEQGLFPVLLTMLYLREISDHAFHCLPGIEVSDASSSTQDLDIIAACDGILVAAECKTLVKGITTLTSEIEEQICKTAELSAKIGIRILFVAGLFSAVPDALQNLILDLNRRYGDSMIVHVLDRTHLEYEHSYRDIDGRHKIGRYLPKIDNSLNVGKIRDDGNFTFGIM